MIWLLCLVLDKLFQKLLLQCKGCEVAYSCWLMHSMKRRVHVSLVLL